MQICIYCEKYSLAKTIANALGAGDRIPNPNDKFSAHWEFDFHGKSAVIVHGSGHLATLAKPEEYDEKLKFWSFSNYPFLPEKYKLTQNENTKKLLKYVQNYLQNAELIINACDPDREGELIFQYVLEISGLENKPWKRAILPDLTEKTIVNAFENLRSSEEMNPLVLAGQARSIADWAFGLNLTTCATLKFGNRQNIMNIGRVMTATLNLIFQREMAVKSHIKTPFWKIGGDFEGLKTECAEGKFDDKNTAENVLKQIEGVCGKVKNVQKKLRYENAPLLYNSTNLQADCANILGFELKKTAEIMQKLYEKGFITYPRTSAEHLPIEMKEEVLFTIERLFDTELYGKYKPQTIEEFTKRHFDNEKVTSHTAIIPTLNRATGLSEDEFAVYDLVAKSVLRLAFPKAKYEDTTLEIGVSDYIFKSKTSVLIEKGWRIFDTNSDKNKNSNTEKTIEKTIENLTENAVLNGVFSLIEGETEPPKRFSEASLILAMETCGQHFEDEETREIMKREKKGLGTDATRVETVQKLLKTGFICRKGKTLIPTEKGIFLMENLKSEKLKSPETTGIWEKKLSEIADSKENSENLYTEFIQNVNSSVVEIFEEIKNSDSEKFGGETAENTAKCPFCGCEMRKGKKNFYCSGYYNSPKCDFVIWYENYGKRIGENDLKLLCNSGKTGIIKGFVSKSGKTYDGILVLNRETKKIEMTFPNKK